MEVIGSTEAVDARDNALVTAPVYSLLIGFKIADGFSDIWDGDLDFPILFDQFLASQGTAVYTGTLTTGVQSTVPHGTSTLATFGSSGSISASWINTSMFPSQAPLSFYALSAVQTVPTPGGVVPEAASVFVWLGLASMLGLVGIYRGVSRGGLCCSTLSRVLSASS